MELLIAAQTDTGLRKKNNQDSLCVMKMSTPQGAMAFAVLCDGMGGYEKGEVASASVVRAFRDWAQTKLPELSLQPIDEAQIQEQWMQIVLDQNRLIKDYGDELGTRMGTTAVVILVTEGRYCILNVGDSRAYEITGEVRQITEDQSLVAREVKTGRMTPEEAEKSAKRNVLLQCIGGANQVMPDLYFGERKDQAVYLLCSDGFRHEVTTGELYTYLQPRVLQSASVMHCSIGKLIEINKERQEKDNISALLIRTF